MRFFLGTCYQLGRSFKLRHYTSLPCQFSSFSSISDVKQKQIHSNSGSSSSLILKLAKVNHHVPVIRHPLSVNDSAKRYFYRLNNNEYERFKRNGYRSGGSATGRRTTYVIVVICGLGLSIHYYSHLEKVPISGRTRYMNATDSMEKMLGQASFDSMINQVQNQILPPSHPLSIYVQRVTDNLMNAVHKLPGISPIEYSVYVVNSPLVNAMVLPGGQIFVFTGIIPITGNEDGLATVLAHEISHKLLRHHAERLSLYSLVMILLSGVTFFVGGIPFFNEMITNLGIILPNSRKTEREADYVGLRLMSMACYDPNEATKFWQRMEAYSEKHHSASSTISKVQFFSTHPTHYNRIETIKSWIPEAVRNRSEAGCDEVSDFWQKWRF